MIMELNNIIILALLYAKNLYYNEIIELMRQVNFPIKYQNLNRIIKKLINESYISQQKMQSIPPRANIFITQKGRKYIQDVASLFSNIFPAKSQKRNESKSNSMSCELDNLELEIVELLSNEFSDFSEFSEIAEVVKNLSVKIIKIVKKYI